MNKKLRSSAIAFFCAIAVLSTGFSAVTLLRLKKLEANVGMVQQSVTSIDSDINSTLNQAITTITESAVKNASIVADYKVKWGECSHADKTMQLAVRIMPKEYTDSTIVRVRYSGYSAKGQGYDMVFDCEGFEEQAAEAARLESGVYQADITIPIADYISLTAEVQEGDTVKQEKLDDQYAAWGLKLLHPQMSGGFGNYEVHASDKKTIKYDAHAAVNLMETYDAGGVSDSVQMTDGRITMYLNGEEILVKKLGENDLADGEDAPASKVIQDDGSVLTVWSGDTTNYPTRWSGELTLADGDVVTFVMSITDENGFTYEQEVERTTFEVEGGWIKGSESMSNFGGIVIK